MANTKIQIRRSSVTSTPPGSSLSVAEPAYSYSSNTLFLGGSDGVGVLPIGGKFYVDQQSVIFGVTNAAFFAANSGTTGSNTYAQTVGTAGNNYASILVANTAAAINANSAASYAAINSYSTVMDTAGNNYASVLVANTATAINSYISTSFTSTNNYTNYVGAASNNYSNSTFVKLIATSQTITGDLSITGNLTFLGNAVTVSSNNLIVGDSLIYLAANNYTGTDILDIGFIANYGNTTGANVHTGLVRDATTKQYYLFQGYDAELQGNNTTFTFGANNSSYAILNADINAGNITVAGINVYSYFISSAAGANNFAGLLANNVNANASVSYAAINSYAAFIGTSANNYAGAMANASNLTVRSVTYGGTGNTTFTANGILFGNGTGPVLVTGAGTDGQVLQSVQGVPQFGMLDGGTF